MNTKVVVLVTVLVITAISFVVLIPKDTPTNTVAEIALSYDEINSTLKSELSIMNISMSTPLKFQGESLKKYCMFFDPDKSSDIEYCTSTELLDSKGNFLGNIHITGKKNNPENIFVIIQSDPFISNNDNINSVFTTVIENIVCDCWPQEKPGGFETVYDWIEAAKLHHMEGKQTSSISKISGLGKNPFFLEITTNVDGYLWKLVVLS